IFDVKSGKGSVGELLYDTTFVTILNKTMTNFQTMSDSLVLVTKDIQLISDLILNGNGALGTVLTDSTFDNNLNETMQHIKTTSESLEENMEALKHNILFRRYYKKKAKEKKE